MIRQCVEAFNIKQLELDGYEADDIIASYTKLARNQKMDSLIVSSDKDLMQLVNENVSMLDPMKNINIGIDQVIDKLVKKLGEVKTAYLIGDYARGIDSGLIDIVLVGNINKTELDRIATVRGQEISRKIRPLVVTKQELQQLWLQLDMNHALLIWGEEIIA